MLKKVEIHNFAIIESAIFEPGKHFTVISGETGAGKSLLIDALGSLTGRRAKKEFVRKGASFARVEALFYFDEEDFIPLIIREHLEEGSLILSREIYADGGSQARINGRLSSISLLREVSQNLIGLHAQNEQLSLFEPSEQRNLLDKFAGEKLTSLLDDWHKLLKDRKTMLEKIRVYGLSPEERDRRIDLLEYQLAEISKADLKVDEEQKLLTRNKLLSAVARIKKDLFEGLEILSNNEEQNALYFVNSAIQKLDFSSEYSKNIAQIQNELQTLSYELDQIIKDLHSTFEQLDVEPNEIEMINLRLDLINKLKIKYGDSIEEILSFYQKSKAELQDLIKGEEFFKQYQQKLNKNEQALNELAVKIHKLRLKSGEKLAKEITEALSQLAMPDARFSVKVELIEINNKGYYGKYGRDQIEFQIQPNPGEPLMPLRKIASGGEVSRILLAIKSIFGKNDQLSVLIFDEIDTGISGKTANQVAMMLKKLAFNKQVLCVSHMAQITAAADTHYLIQKYVEDNRTKTNLKLLNQEQRKNEIARLLSGKEQDQNSLSLAAQLLENHNLN